MAKLKNLMNPAVLEPFMCKDKDEFYKALLITSETLPMVEKMDDAQNSFVDMFKMLAHDYLALVLKGDLDAYEFSANDAAYKELRESFENALHHCNLALGMAGVPMKETDSGELAIDWTKVDQDKKEKEVK